MPEELNTAIETVASSQRQSKSEFIREGLRRYLREVEFNELQNKERQETKSTRSVGLVEVYQHPWGLLIAWFCISMGVTSTFLYYFRV
jgi:metal-responsive CopG/Arc/MetJ family transcriptional regulator